jgi:hypothetical protein
MMPGSSHALQKSTNDDGLVACFGMSIALVVIKLCVIGFGWLLMAISLTEAASWIVWFLNWIVIVAAVLLMLGTVAEIRSKLRTNREQGQPSSQGLLVWSNLVTPICLMAAVWIPSSTPGRDRTGLPFVSTASQPSPASLEQVETTNPHSGQLAEIQSKIAKLESGRAASIGLLEKTIEEKESLTQMLRDMGVSSSADLQRVAGAKSYAESLQRLITEADRYRRDVARFDKAINEANGLVRRLERSEAMAGMELEEELAVLSEQTMSLDEAIDGMSSTEKPDTIQFADNLDNELKRQLSVPQKPKTSSSLAEQLVGKWEVGKGHMTGMVEFTKGGAVLLTWDDGITNGLGQRGRQATLKYQLESNVLRIYEANQDYGEDFKVEIEAIGEDELILINQQDSMSFDWIDGRIKRMKPQ